jgi:hypothetical protein
MSDKVTVNPDGSINIPGVGTREMVGVDPAHFQQKQHEHKQRMAIIQRQMRSVYRCTECKRKWVGRDVRVVQRRINGTMMEVLVCPDRRCDGPVVLFQDALSLTNPPRDAANAVTNPKPPGGPRKP